MAADMPAGSTSKAMYWVGWVLSVLPAPLLLMSGISKVMLGPDVAKGFGDLGWTTDAAMVLAALELGSLVLYLIPQTAVLGAILLTGYLGGACATHVRIADYSHCWIPVALGVVVWLGLYLRDPRVRALAPIRSL
jgi:DoxX-like family